MTNGIIGTYSGDTFKNLMRQYSNARMNRDRVYRQRVLEIITQRQDSKKDEPCPIKSQ